VAALLGIKPASAPPLVRRHRLQAMGKGKARRSPRATVEALQDRQCQGASVETTNQYLVDRYHLYATACGTASGPAPSPGSPRTPST
jgi:hypothetical protein